MEDGPILYRYLQHSMEHGLGYAEDYMPTYDYFYSKCLAIAQWTIIENAVGEILMAYGVIPSPFTRPVTYQFIAGYTLVNPAFKGRNVLSQLKGVYPSLVSIHNCKGLLATVHVNNVPVLKGMKDDGFQFLGYIPNAEVVKGKYIDCIFACFRRPEDEADNLFLNAKI